MGRIPLIASICAICFLCVLPTTNAADTTFHNSLKSFSANLFSRIYQSQPAESLIYSPFSIQSCLAMVRMGAEGQTAEEMDRGLSLTGQNPQTVANNYHSMLAKYVDGKIVKIANKVYIAKDAELSEEYRGVLADKFFSGAENIDFSQSIKAADTVNSWVAAKTNYMIQNLVADDTLDSDTRLLLLSALHFNGQWEVAFPKENTQLRDFYVDDNHTIQVPMMEVTAVFQYGFIKSIGSQVVRLPYKDSDLSMLIVVPNKISDIEPLLKEFDFQAFSKTKMISGRQVKLWLPKFKAEFEIELSDILKKMGMNEMFANADFSKMLKSQGPMQVSTVIHKAFIDVTEEGAKAAGAAAVVKYQRDGPYIFEALQPFYYAIIDENFVPLFQGTYTGK